VDKSSDKPTEDFTHTWRYKTGLGLIISGHVVLLLGFLASIFGLAGGGWVGALILGGELVSLSSIVFLGKAGFLAIKSKIFRFLKEGYAGPISAVRHYIGIALALTSVVTTYLTFVYAWVAFKSTTPEQPFPVIFGMTFNEQSTFVLTLFLVGEVSFLLAIYVLGADWWERFRSIFVWHGPKQEANG
jgi:hypothetical protein